MKDAHCVFAPCDEVTSVRAPKIRDLRIRRREAPPLVSDHRFSRTNSGDISSDAKDFCEWALDHGSRRCAMAPGVFAEAAVRTGCASASRSMLHGASFRLRREDQRDTLERCRRVVRKPVHGKAAEVQPRREASDRRIARLTKKRRIVKRVPCLAIRGSDGLRPMDQIS